MVAQHEHRWGRAMSGAAALFALVPWAVLSWMWGFILFMSLWGTSVRGEENVTAMIAAVLFFAALGFCVLAGLALAHRTRFSRGSGFVVALLVAIVWTGSVVAWMVHGGLSALPPLPTPIWLAVGTGFTVPVAAVGVLVMMVEAAVRRRRNRLSSPGARADLRPSHTDRFEKLGG